QFRLISQQAAPVAMLSLMLLSTVGQAAYAADAVQLPPLVISGDTDLETATGPVPGYVAERGNIGSKTDTALVDVPQSITVVSRKPLDAQDVQTLDQALRYVAATSSQDNDLRFDQVSIRGFDADYYLDGMKLNRAVWFANPRIDPWFLE